MSSSKTAAYRNIIGQFVSVVTGLGAFLGILNLQSSVNAAEGLGLISNILTYVSLVVSVFITPTVVSLVGTKISLSLSSSILLIYALCNYYPHWYTLLPVSLFSGLGLSLLWVSMYSHSTAIANKYYKILHNNQTRDQAVVLLTSIAGISIQLAAVSGSSISSVVLFNLKTNNASFVDDDEVIVNGTVLSCGEYEQGHYVDKVLYYTLTTIYLLMNITSLIINVIFLDNFRTNSSFQSCSNVCKDFLRTQFEFFKTLLSIKSFLLFPMFVLDGILLGFVVGAFSKFFVSDCIGVKWVGFIHSVYGTVGGLAVFLTGRALRYRPSQHVVVFIAVIVTGAMTAALIFWERVPNLLIIFGLASGWAVGQGMTMALGPGIAGVLFPNRQEQIFGCYRLGTAIGFIMTFTATLLIPMSHQLWIIMSVILLTGVFYSPLICSNTKSTDNMISKKPTDIDDANKIKDKANSIESVSSDNGNRDITVVL